MVAQPAERHTDHHLREQLVALARNAQVNVDLDDPADYWYRLGQRNAYAQALGLSAARGVDQVAFEIADRLTDALSNGEHDVNFLLSRAIEAAPAATNDSPQWLGPHAFRAQYGHVPGVDRDYGMRWGETGNQRISWRAPLDASRGLLYAYDPLWNEYQVLGTDVPRQAVDAAFKQSLDSDIHMDVGAFGEVVRSQVILGRMSPIQPLAANEPTRVIEP
ncbi:hypothetical protein ACFUC1_02405 [Pedococcus sp. NPDC057267]|uniref:hypothetical protein n=1 Tax=Pedococcus sp. NPDC057267 TaxID=3346077 RepID=UPI0036353F28